MKIKVFLLFSVLAMFLVTPTVAKAQIFKEYTATTADTLTNGDTLVYVVPTPINWEVGSSINWTIALDLTSGTPALYADTEVTNFSGKLTTDRWYKIKTDTITNTAAKNVKQVTTTTDALRTRLVLRQTGTGKQLPRVAVAIRRKP